MKMRIAPLPTPPRSTNPELTPLSASLQPLPIAPQRWRAKLNQFACPLPTITSDGLDKLSQREPLLDNIKQTVLLETNEQPFTDQDLKEALSPIIEEAMKQAVSSRERGMDDQLEPMLRATIRHVMAESSAQGPFRQLRPLDRISWLLQAIFTSRTFDELLFEKTRRFMVEEVFLIDRETLAMISYASRDPARHASAKRVKNTIHRLVNHVRDEDGKLQPIIELYQGRSARAYEGQFTILVAVMRGTPSQVVPADLKFSLRRIEDFFRAELSKLGTPLLRELQPFLEDCLLIQAPATRQ